MAENSVTITGNITRDPELRFTTGGNAVCTFGIAHNRRWRNKQTNEYDESVSFFDVTAWGTLAENVSESLVKGARVTVTGRLEQRSWETQEGERRSKIEIVADEVSPSLRWATVEIIRNERRGDGDYADSGRGGADRSGGAQQSRPQYERDEEPF